MNLFADIPARLPDEEFRTLLSRPGVRIERIVSTGQITPPDQWFDQAWDEWVVVLSGAARLLLEGEAERTLGSGDHAFIPSHRRHRVTWTDDTQPTVWLAVHFAPAEGVE